MVRYQAATDDVEFESDVGLELLVETARLWHSLGHHDAEGRFRIDGVTGPDEYSAIADDNVYTNLLAQRNLAGRGRIGDPPAAPGGRPRRNPRGSLGLARRGRERGRPVGRPARRPPAVRELHRSRVWDFDGTRAEQYPLLLHFPYFDLYRKQVVKQPDLVLALHWCGDAFTDEEKARDFDYYEALTVRDSSLAACTQAVVAAEVGHLDLAYDYLGESALLDLLDLEHNTRDGLHIASLAGVWLATVAGFGGMRDHDGNLSFAPRLSPQLERLAFRISFRGRRLAGRGRPDRGHLHRPRRPAARDRPPRRADRDLPGHAGHACDPGPRLTARTDPTTGPRAGPSRRPGAGLMGTGARLSGAVVVVRDLARSEGFYRELLELRVDASSAEAVLLSAPTGDRLALRALGRAQHLSAGIGVQCLVWTAESLDDLARCEEVLRERGTFSSSSVDHGVTVVEGRDPDGIRVIVVSPVAPGSHRTSLPSGIYAY